MSAVRPRQDAPGCPCGSVVEHSLGKGEVGSSILPMGTTLFWLCGRTSRFQLASASNPVQGLAPCGVRCFSAARNSLKLVSRTEIPLNVSRRLNWPLSLCLAIATPRPVLALAGCGRNVWGWLADMIVLLCDSPAVLPSPRNFAVTKFTWNRMPWCPAFRKVAAPV